MHTSDGGILFMLLVPIAATNKKNLKFFYEYENKFKTPT
jgi:hypothetical protein